MTYRLEVGDDAKADILKILQWSVSNFGPDVRDGYRALIETVLTSIARDPNLPGSHDRDDIRPDIRTVHLRSGRDRVSPGVRRIASPRHFVVYRKVGEVVQVVRLLHDAMNLPEQHFD